MAPASSYVTENIEKGGGWPGASSTCPRSSSSSSSYMSHSLTPFSTSGIPTDYYPGFIFGIARSNSKICISCTSEPANDEDVPQCLCLGEVT
ncbi:hypothetical protein H6P81_020632 [Aristolochia fimbriata]|uniref:Uncharacterized protein n=1 Tax=Aristolochia fimbriata TaxID=158543 RepID=A0AAV7DUY8_ARIFI|nr:hypothetical protein H6P81_020632 [Aristolochia fimbriata]